jgi:hypothetical protein
MNRQKDAERFESTKQRLNKKHFNEERLAYDQNSSKAVNNQRTSNEEQKENLRRNSGMTRTKEMPYEFKLSFIKGEANTNLLSTYQYSTDATISLATRSWKTSSPRYISLAYSPLTILEPDILALWIKGSGAQ